MVWQTEVNSGPELLGGGGKEPRAWLVLDASLGANQQSAFQNLEFSPYGCNQWHTYQGCLKWLQWGAGGATHTVQCGAWGTYCDTPLVAMPLLMTL